MQNNDLESLRALIIDDQKSMRMIIRSMLNQIGIRDVGEAENGREGLAVLSDARLRDPDLIICDLHMREMDGLTFCNKVRRDESLRARHVPIIILTGDRDPLLHDVARQVGAVQVLTKPITAAQLADRIRAVVGFAFGAQQAARPGC